MAGNIYGYQGVHTPLESVTQGRYTLSDYTSMRTELTSRLIALENQGGFVPTNVEITGYLHMLPGSAGTGEIETTSSITGDSLYINTEAHCGNFLCDGAAIINGTTTFGGNVTVNGGAILSGNGSGLTNINDITKVPISGGTMTGSLTLTAPAKFIGDGSLLTGIVSTVPAPLYTYYPVGSGITTTLSSSNQRNVYNVALTVAKTFSFSTIVMGQTFTFMRPAVDLVQSTILTSSAGTLKFRAFTLNGVQTDCNGSGTFVILNYAYGGITQKIRNTFMVVPTTDITYAFDLYEIS